MSRHRLSPSKLGLAAKCAWWARADVEYPEQESGRAARIGTLVHKFAEAIANGDAVKADQSGDLHEVAEALSIVQGPLTGWLASWRAHKGVRAVEIGLRYDVETGAVRLYPRRGEPGYERPLATEIGGEIDLLRLDGDTLEIIDLKTGRPEYFTDEQLRAYGVLASTYFDVPKVRVAFLRALKTKVSLTPWVSIDADELDAEAGRLRRTLRLLPQAMPEPGEHCWQCDAGPKRANVCPAHHQPTEQEREAAFAY